MNASELQLERHYHKFLFHSGLKNTNFIAEKRNKNLAIANKSRVSCAYNTLKASMITP